MKNAVKTKGFFVVRLPQIFALVHGKPMINLKLGYYLNFVSKQICVCLPLSAFFTHSGTILSPEDAEKAIDAGCKYDVLGHVFYY